MTRLTSRKRTEITEDLIELDDRYTALSESHTAEQLMWPPAYDGWSIAQCIEHVARMNSAYLIAIKTAISTNLGPAGFQQQSITTAGWFSTYFLKTVSPEGKPKLPSPKIGRPSAAVLPSNPEAALRELKHTHEEIRAILSSSNQPDLNGIRFKNPFVPFVRFTVGSGILIMAGHGRRHLLQAERICQMENFPKAQSVGKTA